MLTAVLLMVLAAPPLQQALVGTWHLDQPDATRTLSLRPNGDYEWSAVMMDRSGSTHTLTRGTWKIDRDGTLVMSISDGMTMSFKSSIAKRGQELSLQPVFLWVPDPEGTRKLNSQVPAAPTLVYRKLADFKG